jgi:type IV pilus assembly protein PilM
MVALRKSFDPAHPRRGQDGDNCSYTVEAAAIAEIATSDDINQRKINTIRAIHECLKSTGTRRKLAVCGVSGPEVAVRDFEFPLLDAEEIPGAVRLEASQVCPFNIDDGAVDYQLIALRKSTKGRPAKGSPGELTAESQGQPQVSVPANIPEGPDAHSQVSVDDDNGSTEFAEVKTKGILVAATNKLINNKIQFAKEAHLKCVLMDVDGLALLNCFNKLANKNENLQAGKTIAILNAGASNMTIAIMGANGRPFIRDMAYAGDDIIEQISIEKNMSTESVKEKLFNNSQIPQVHQGKPNGGMTRPTDGDEPGYSLEKVDQAIPYGACRKVIDDVAETLRFYSAQVKSTRADRIFVCGGFALAAGFVELLSSQLGIEAVFWNPFEKLRCEEGQQYQNIFKERGSAMAVAAGLAMRSI